MSIRGTRVSSCPSFREEQTMMSELRFEPPNGPDVLTQACEAVAKLPPLLNAPEGERALPEEGPRYRTWKICLSGEGGPRDRFCVVLGDMLIELLNDIALDLTAERGASYSTFPPTDYYPRPTGGPPQD